MVDTARQMDESARALDFRILFPYTVNDLIWNSVEEVMAKTPFELHYLTFRAKSVHATCLFSFSCRLGTCTANRLTHTQVALF